MRFAYADPPYLGQAKKHYGREEVDHLLLIEQLIADFPDGWALSCSSPSLFDLLPMINLRRSELTLAGRLIRIAAWVKPFAIFKPNVNPAYAWEPVLFTGGRPRTRQQPTVRDWVSCNITLKKGLSGAKPEAFCYWLFELLGMQDGDELADLFPGTGAVTKAWEKYRAQLAIDGTVLALSKPEWECNFCKRKYDAPREECSCGCDVFVKVAS